MSSTRRLISSLEIVRRVNEAALAYTLAHMKVLERIPGNPVGIAWRTLGGATALMARNPPSASFNSIAKLDGRPVATAIPRAIWSPLA